MHIGRQTMRQHAQKDRGPPIRQQVEIIDENKAGRLSRERMAQIIHQEPRARRIGRTAVVPENIQAGARKGVLHTSP